MAVGASTRCENVGCTSSSRIVSTIERGREELRTYFEEETGCVGNVDVRRINTIRQQTFGAHKVPRDRDDGLCAIVAHRRVPRKLRRAIGFVEGVLDGKGEDEEAVVGAVEDGHLDSESIAFTVDAIRWDTDDPVHAPLVNLSEESAHDLRTGRRESARVGREDGNVLVCRLVETRESLRIRVDGVERTQDDRV